MSNIIVFCEVKQGKLRTVAKEAVSAAGRIAQGLSAKVTGLVIGASFLWDEEYFDL